MNPEHARIPTIEFYGCVRCQASHGEGEPLFRAHIGWQSKHGTQRMRADHWDAGRMTLREWLRGFPSLVSLRPWHGVGVMARFEGVGEVRVPGNVVLSPADFAEFSRPALGEGVAV